MKVKLTYLALLSGLSLLAGYLQLISPAVSELDNSRDREEMLKIGIEQKQKLFVNLDKVKTQLREVDSMIRELAEAMPARIDVDGEGVRLLSAAGRHNLSPVTLIFKTGIVFGEFYERHPIRLTLAGSFIDIYHYLYDDFYATSRTISLTGFSLARSAGSDRLTLEADGFMFAYSPQED